MWQYSQCWAKPLHGQTAGLNYESWYDEETRVSIIHLEDSEPCDFFSTSCGFDPTRSRQQQNCLSFLEKFLALMVRRSFPCQALLKSSVTSEALRLFYGTQLHKCKNVWVFVSPFETEILLRLSPPIAPKTCHHHLQITIFHVQVATAKSARRRSEATTA